MTDKKNLTPGALCWNCASINKDTLATEPPTDACQYTQETTKGLCDACRKLAVGEPVDCFDLLLASNEDYRENL